MTLATRQLRVLNRLFKVSGDERDAYFCLHTAHGEFSESLVATLLSIIENDFVCLDIGANLGLTTLLLSILARKGSVHAFEPNPVTFAMLQRNVSDNNLSNVFCHNLALSSAPGQLRFKSNEGLLAGSVAFRDHDTRAASVFNDLIAVDAISVDAFVERNSLTRIDLLKVDVEGFELEVLAGCTETIRRFRPTVFIELNSSTLIRFADVSPRTALANICEMFPETYLVDRDTGLLRPLVGQRDQDELIYHNLTGGLVDNLVCTFPENRLLDRSRHIEELIRRPTGLTPTLAYQELAAIRTSLSWRITAPLRRAKQLLRRLSKQSAA